MKSVAMYGEKRSTIGKRASKDLRDQGKVPCVLYGNGNEPVHFFMYEGDFKLLVYTPDTFTAKIHIGDDVYRAMLKDIQYHPVNESIMHADFQVITESKPVTMDIPVKVVGNSPGVRAGGKLVKKIKKLRVRGLLKDLPDSIEVNIDDVELGKSIKVSEMNAHGLTFLDSPVNAILSVVTTRSTQKEGAAQA